MTAHTTTTITLDTGTTGNYAVGARVVPVRVGYIPTEPTGQRAKKNAVRRKIRFRVQQNGADIADDSAFPSFNSSPRLSDCNVLPSNRLTESFPGGTQSFDPGVGRPFQDSEWLAHRRAHDMARAPKSKQELWELRQLLFSIKGRWKPFYLATFAPDMTVVADVTLGSNQVQVENTGYNRFVQQLSPRNVIRVVFADGTADEFYTITDSTETSSSVETLTLDGTWPVSYTAAQFSHFEFLEKVRFAADRIQFVHEPYRVLMRSRVITVLE